LLPSPKAPRSFQVAGRSACRYREAHASQPAICGYVGRARRTPIFPTNNLFQVGGVGVASAASRKGDINSFQLVQAAHDLDFQNARGDQLETRVTGYATEQFRLPQYSVALFAGSIGPRIHIAPDLYPGLSIKPYLTAGALSRRLSGAGGAGMSSAELSATCGSSGPMAAIWDDPRQAIGYLGGVSPYSAVSTLRRGRRHRLPEQLIQTDQRRGLKVASPIRAPGRAIRSNLPIRLTFRRCCGSRSIRHFRSFRADGPSRLMAALRILRSTPPIR
jgi:hypothetical protein